MKKVLYILLALLILAGAAFALSSTTLFKGTLPGGAGTGTGDFGGTGGIPTFEGVAGGTFGSTGVTTPSGTDTTDTTIPTDTTVPTGTVPTIPTDTTSGQGDDVVTYEPEGPTTGTVRLRLLDENGDFISGLSESDFTVFGDDTEILGFEERDSYTFYGNTYDLGVYDFDLVYSDTASYKYGFEIAPAGFESVTTAEYDVLADQEADVHEITLTSTTNVYVISIGYDSDSESFTANICADNLGMYTEAVVEWEANETTTNYTTTLEEPCMTEYIGDLEGNFGITEIGNYDVKVTIDTFDSLIETDETDNEITDTVEVTASQVIACTDLTTSTVTMSSFGIDDITEITIDLTMDYVDEVTSFRPSTYMYASTLHAMIDTSALDPISPWSGFGTGVIEELDSGATSSSGIDFDPSSSMSPDLELSLGTLIVETDGDGDLLDQDGNTGSSLEFNISGLEATLTVWITGYESGDTVTVYVENETDCTDTITLDSETGLACTSLNIDPDEYILAADDTDVPDIDFSVTFTAEGDAVSSIRKFFSDLFASLLSFTTIPDTVWSGTMIVETSGSGTLSNESNSNSGTEMAISVYGDEYTIEGTYTGGEVGDTITAYIDGEETVCIDTLTIEQEEEDATTTTTTTTTTTDEETTTTTTTTTDEEIATTDTTVDIRTAGACTHPFTDVEDHYAENRICRLYKADIVDGKTSTIFDPDAYITEAELIKVLILNAGYEPSYVNPGLQNISPGDWYYPYYATAAQLDMVRARDGFVPQPNLPVSRGVMALYAIRLYEQTLYGWDASDIPFSDLSTSDFFTYAVLIAYNEIVETPTIDGDDTETVRILEGYSDGTFKPYAYTTRADAMSFLLRLYNADWPDNN